MSRAFVTGVGGQVVDLVRVGLAKRPDQARHVGEVTVVEANVGQELAD